MSDQDLNSLRDEFVKIMGKGFDPEISGESRYPIEFHKGAQGDVLVFMRESVVPHDHNEIIPVAVANMVVTQADNFLREKGYAGARLHDWNTTHVPTPDQQVLINKRFDVNPNGGVM